MHRRRAAGPLAEGSPLKLQIADTSRAPGPHPDRCHGALLIRSGPAVSALREYFEFPWETSHPAGPAPANDPVPPDLRPIINLLAQGPPRRTSGKGSACSTRPCTAA